MISIIIVNSLNWFQLFIWNLGKDKDLIVLLQYIFTILTEADYLVHITFQALFCIFSIYRCAAKSLQSCLTLWDPTDGSPPGSAIPGILQATILEWQYRFSSVQLLSRVQLCATPKTAAHQALLSLGFPRQEHWNGLPFPSPVHESEKWKWSHSVVSES